MLGRDTSGLSSIFTGLLLRSPLSPAALNTFSVVISSLFSHFHLIWGPHYFLDTQFSFKMPTFLFQNIYKFNLFKMPIFDIPTCLRNPGFLLSSPTTSLHLRAGMELLPSKAQEAATTPICMIQVLLLTLAKVMTPKSPLMFEQRIFSISYGHE